MKHRSHFCWRGDFHLKRPIKHQAKAAAIWKESDWGTKAVSLHGLKAAVWVLMFTKQCTVGDGPAGAIPHVTALSETWNRKTSSTCYNHAMCFPLLLATWLWSTPRAAKMQLYCRMNNRKTNRFVIPSSHIISNMKAHTSSESYETFHTVFKFSFLYLHPGWVIYLFIFCARPVVSVIWSCIQALLPTCALLKLVISFPH